MENAAIWEQLFASLKENREYTESGETVRRLEPGFLAAMETLTEAQREQLDRYIAACDAQSDAMILQAYRLGYENGRQDKGIFVG